MFRADGFTLVEVIVTFVILAIVGALAGFGFIQAAKSFTFSKENTERALQLQLVMNRMQLELENIYDVYSAQDKTFCYGFRHKTLYPDQKRCVWLQGSEIRMRNGENPSGGKVMIDDIQNLDFQYADNEGNSWSSGDKVRELYSVGVSMDAVVNDESVEVSGTFNPRRNMRYNAPYMWNRD